MGIAQEILALQGRVTTLENECVELAERLDGMEEAQKDSVNSLTYRLPIRIANRPFILRRLGIGRDPRQTAEV